MGGHVIIFIFPVHIHIMSEIIPVYIIRECMNTILQILETVSIFTFPLGLFWQMIKEQLHIYILYYIIISDGLFRSMHYLDPSII